MQIAADHIWIQGGYQIERLLAVCGGAHYLYFRRARQQALQDVQHDRGIIYQ
jgi:hypothetical protein